MEIITNHQPRNVINWYELSDKERADFDWEGANECCYFRYRGNVYCLSEFMRASGNIALLGWDGMEADSYFSGTLVKYADDCGDSVIVASCYS